MSLLAVVMMPAAVQGLDDALHRRRVLAAQRSQIQVVLRTVEEVSWGSHANVDRRYRCQTAIPAVGLSDELLGGHAILRREDLCVWPCSGAQEVQNLPHVLRLGPQDHQVGRPVFRSDRRRSLDGYA